MNGAQLTTIILAGISLLGNVLLGFLHQNLRNTVQNNLPTPAPASPIPSLTVANITEAVLAALAPAQGAHTTTTPTSYHTGP